MTKEIDFSALALKYNVSRLRLIIVSHDVIFLPSATDHSYLRDVVSLVASDLKNHVMLISGRDKESLAASWNHIPVILAAESGGFYRNPGNSWHSVFSYNTDWISRTLSPLNALCFQYEGSFVEPRSYSLVWHFDAVGSRMNEDEKQQILAAIRSLPDYEYFTIHLDDNKIELRTRGIERDAFLARWMGSRQYDFMMMLGCGSQDEGLFKIIGDSGFTIRVGSSAYSSAQLYLNGKDDVLPFLQKLLEINLSFEKATAKIGIQN